MNQFEQNVINSFSLAKCDITTLFNHIKFILNQVEELKKENAELKVKVDNLTKTPKRKIIVKTNKRNVGKTVKVIRTNKKIVAAKNSKKVHDHKCPFAQNIMPKNKLVFSSKVKALNEGYKLCRCLN